MFDALVNNPGQKKVLVSKESLRSLMCPSSSNSGMITTRDRDT